MQRLIVLPLIAFAVLFAGCGEEAEPEPEKFFGVWKLDSDGENARQVTIEFKPPNRFTWTESSVLGGIFKTNEIGINFILQEPKDLVEREKKVAGVDVWQWPYRYRFDGETFVLIPTNGAPEMPMKKQ